MLHIKIIDVSKEKIDLVKAQKFIASSKCGASIYFVGTVRDQNDNKKVTGITYDSHDALVIKSFEEIYKEAETKFKFNNIAVFIEHIKGYAALGDTSIIIAVACKHRTQAYDLSRFIIEEIKKRTPIWKKEHYKNKDSEWLKGNPIKSS
jgi:molybdopterin synthase catalytic subunit